MKTRTVLAVTGILIMGYAVAGALHDPDLAPAGVLTFLAGVLVVHDVIWMPALLAAGAVITRLVPRRRRPAVIAATICAAAITVVALPLVLGFGRPADNPSALPSAYGRNLIVVLLVVAVAALLRRRPAKGRKNSERPGRNVRGAGHG
ncbi:peptidoglycan/LPS O-acetylase OafA/YrhL [Actinoplanes campanulatus]|uniref:Peptidoglycan/LPS O-acetylase OafA/YrhL n=1 Tax=Actinoplanes campanulatus TaxID=113559 RepID=A0A7W5FJR4_9ACTN|nr:hypothetical protein [Actinoplanes campanulatus]MBB3101019.1 peptidoglycan/LPS O-acetylase OafA/YrhL [Actinoplanes campanulatus]GGN49248.1 hypothetical protein GCM10010109_87100 [Actinoplanes campanulatus]GID41891.1 hypothetical protein Aca09nite_83970 [Actinoplanes campanulatus]